MEDPIGAGFHPEGDKTLGDFAVCFSLARHCYMQTASLKTIGLLLQLVGMPQQPLPVQVMSKRAGNVPCLPCEVAYAPGLAD